MTQAYTTELTLEQCVAVEPRRYELLASLFTPETATGRPRTVNMMLVIQGILYVLVSSCAWRCCTVDHLHNTHLVTAVEPRACRHKYLD